MTRRLWMAALFGAALGLVACGGEDGGNETPTAACTALWETQLRLGSRIYSEAPAGGRFADYAIDFDGTITYPAPISCTDGIAVGLASACNGCEANPAQCELAVRTVFLDPPASCHVCGDGVCTGNEDPSTCPEDCAVQCGDGKCELSESVLACPIDCATACGDRVCGEGETPETCPNDCNYTRGNGLCEPGEGPEIAPEDCNSGTCGDRVCQSDETTLLCAQDCCLPVVCNVDGGSVCADDDTVATCEVDGFMGCPELIDPTPCALGCERVGIDFGCTPDDPECPRGRCRTCEGVAADYLRSQGIDSMVVELGCTPGETFCSTMLGEGVATCVAVPTAPTCGYGEITLCEAGQTCMDGVCQ